MTDVQARLCRACGSAINQPSGGRGGRPRQHCYTCRPSKAAERRRQRDHERLTAPCLRCGQAIERKVSTVGARRKYCHSCEPSTFAAAEVELDTLLVRPCTTEFERSVLTTTAERAEAAGWTPKAVGTVLAGLRRALDRAENGQPVALSLVRAELPEANKAKLVTAVLDEYEALNDDTVPSIRVWIDRTSAQVPEGFRTDVHAWLLELHAGGARTRPRSPSTLYAYFGRVRPHVITWSRAYESLREVTEEDIGDVLDNLKGHQRAGTFTSLRSLFGFARRHKLVFADPMRRLHVGAAPKRTVMPLTDAEIVSVKRVATTLVQRLVVALVAVYAARAAAIRHLTLDHVDLTRRRLLIGGTFRPMPDLLHQLLREWLTERQQLWPHTPNRHILLTRVSAAETGPVPDSYLSWHLAMQDIPLEHLRADRVLHEAVAVDADPLHLAAAFGLSVQTAIDYSEIARSLLSTAVEAPPSKRDS